MLGRKTTEVCPREIIRQKKKNDVENEPEKSGLDDGEDVGVIAALSGTLRPGRDMEINTGVTLKCRSNLLHYHTESCSNCQQTLS